MTLNTVGESSLIPLFSPCYHGLEVSPRRRRLFRLFRKEEQRAEEGLRRTRETWFRRVTRLFHNATLEEEFWQELEDLLIGGDLGVPTSEKLLKRVKERVRQEHITDPLEAQGALQGEMVRILDLTSDGAEAPADGPKPFVILVVGVNGTGKTTSIAKLAHRFREGGQRVVLAAADTFRAAAEDQLRLWADRAGAQVISHQPGADPGAVVFDAFRAARSRSAEVLIIDTAGRLHTRHNLMEELKKIRRILAREDPSAPHQVLLVLDATTGQNGLTQAQAFTEVVGVTGILLAKLDGTAKGGIVFAICDLLRIPIAFVGTGEGLEDLAPFQAREFVQALFA